MVEDKAPRSSNSWTSSTANKGHSGGMIRIAVTPAAFEAIAASGLPTRRPQGGP
jgi:hypothetical protein